MRKVRNMKKMMIVLLLLALSATAFATESELIERVEQLESRIERLETAVGPLLAEKEKEHQVARQKARARERMHKDLELYSHEELKEIEALYQVANKKWRSEEGKDSLKQLIRKYDKANRTGCALLYLGQMSEGEEQVKYLTLAVAKHSDCFYGDGVQVGAYARLILSRRYDEDGERGKASQLLDEIKTGFPDSIDHRGRSLVTIIEEGVN